MSVANLRLVADEGEGFSELSRLLEVALLIALELCLLSLFSDDVVDGVRDVVLLADVIGQIGIGVDLEIGEH